MFRISAAFSSDGTAECIKMACFVVHRLAVGTLVDIYLTLSVHSCISNYAVFVVQNARVPSHDYPASSCSRVPHSCPSLSLPGISSWHEGETSSLWLLPSRCGPVPSERLNSVALPECKSMRNTRLVSRPNTGRLITSIFSDSAIC